MRLLIAHMSIVYEEKEDDGAGTFTLVSKLADQEVVHAGQPGRLSQSGHVVRRSFRGMVRAVEALRPSAFDGAERIPEAAWPPKPKPLQGA